MRQFAFSLAIAALFLGACTQKTEDKASSADQDSKVSSSAKDNSNLSEVNKKGTNEVKEPKEVVKKEPKDPDANEAVAKALATKAWSYLETKYNKNGKTMQEAGWGSQASAAISSFVLMGGLKCGVTSLDDPKTEETIGSILQQQTSEGSWSFDPRDPGLQAVYCTSAAVKLLSWIRDHGGEAWEKRVGTQAKKGMEYLRKSQVGAPGSPLADLGEDDIHFGGWAYSKGELGEDKVKIDSKTGKPKPSANLSTTIFVLDAAAAFGVKSDDPLFKRATIFLNRHHNAGEINKGGIIIKTDDGKTVVDPKPDDPNYGGSRYSPNTTKAGSVDVEDDGVILKSYGSMTYALLRAYMHAGLEKDDTRVMLAYRWLAKNFSVTKNPGFPAEGKLDQQGLYYHYMQMMRTLNVYGDKIHNPESGFAINWKKDVLAALKERQKADGQWVNDGHARWYEDIPVLVTAYVLNGLGEIVE